ncbi:MAG: TatD family hydrolase [Desulfuromonadaceae bacterium]|nr:TatD family hydrolase [Desulfuromonadaceae bacterium]MDD5106538.1 TatD family hydrolase [Desulfuromonadaceae bacterium]
MTAELFDSHCHLNLEPLNAACLEFIREAGSVGVKGFLVPGVHPDDWPGIRSLAGEISSVQAAYGIHPMHADRANDRVFEQLREYSCHGVAIGEIGLDPHCPVSLERQELAFREQLRIAVDSGLPVLVHCRQLFQQVLNILREEHAGHTGGIMHAFSGSLEMAREFIRLGFVISICGTVTWDNAVRPLQFARQLPLEHLVLETDAPDLTPQRYRGAFNRPAWLPECAVRVAELRGIPFDEVAVATTAVVRRVLRLESGTIF